MSETKPPTLEQIRAMLDEVARPFVDEASKEIAKAMARGDNTVAARIHYDANRQLRAIYQPLMEFEKLSPPAPFFIARD